MGLSKKVCHFRNALIFGAVLHTFTGLFGIDEVCFMMSGHTITCNYRARPNPASKRRANVSKSDRKSGSAEREVDTRRSSSGPVLNRINDLTRRHRRSSPSRPVSTGSKALDGRTAQIGKG